MSKKVRLCSVDGCSNPHNAKGYCTRHSYQFKKYGDPLHKRAARLCSIDGCDNKHSAKGYCAIHYDRNYKHGDPLHEVSVVRRGRNATCSIEGCDKKHQAKGYCGTHYSRFRLYGDPLVVKRPIVNHGMMGISEYAVWRMMKDRCFQPSNTAYAHYGGRGITVCERWKNSFTTFIEDMGARPSEKHSIDRIDNDGNYSPENCRWATHHEQSRNKRNNINLTHKGVTMCASDWADRIGMQRITLYRRLSTGWSVEDALTTPVRNF